MKNSIFVTILLTILTLHLQAQNAPISTRGCNNETNDLGTITRGENIEFGGKIWSAPVTASNCQKETFNGGRMAVRERNLSLNADCRTNPGHLGDLFSWCAVVRFADELCPHPWRVPTKQDFEELQATVCGYYATDGFITEITKSNMMSGQRSANCFRSFFPDWTQAHDNYCDASGTIIARELPTGSMTLPGGQTIAVNPNNLKPNDWYYWSQSEQNAKNAWVFGTVNMFGLSTIEKNMGISLRCVRDK